MTDSDEKISEKDGAPEGTDTPEPASPLVLEGNGEDRIKSDLTGHALKSTDDDVPSDREVPSSTPSGDVDLESGEGLELKRTPSKVIPRTQRRGLFAQLVIGIPEIDDPVQYSPGIKNVIVFIIACAAIAAPMGYSIVFSMLISDLRYIFPLFRTSLRVSIPIRISST